VSFPAYPDYRDSGFQWLGRIPENWVSIPFGVLFRRTKRIGYADEELLSVYRDYGVIRKSDRDDNFNKASEDLSAYQLVEPGDLAMNKMKAWQGSLGISAHRGIVSPAYFVFAPRQEFHPQFLHHLLRSPPYAAGYMTISKGIRINQWDVDPDHLSTLPVLFPSVDEQTAIAAFLDRETAKIDALVAEQERLIALLREKRQAVISHAVTKGLNPDAPMKDSGVEWLGEIPAHWEIGPIKRYVRVLPGYAFSAAEFSHDSSDWRLLRGINIAPKGLRWDDETVYWSRSEGDGFEGWELVEGDLVIGMDRPWIGDGLRATLVTEEDLPCLLLQRVASLRPKDATDSRFLLRCFQHDAFYHHCAPDLTGVSVPHLSGGQIEEFRIPVPPFDEGQAIADYVDQKLSELQNLIDAAQSAIVLLQERRAALISATVTGKIDVRGVVSQSNVVSIDSARPSILPPLRAVVGAYAIRELGLMGRMAVMKVGYLAESHTGFSDLNGRYERFAAGPYDSSLIEAMQNGAWECYGIVTNEPRDEGKPVTYKVPKGYQPPFNALSALVGEDQARRFLALLSLLKGIGRDGVEAAATLYAVWNDLLAAGKAADDNAICNGVLNDWHPEKAKKFKRDDLDHWLDWMRRNGLVPDGSAPRTDNQGSLFA